MFSFRVLAAILVPAGMAFAADPAAIAQAAASVEQKAAQAPKGQDLEFRLLAAQALQPRFPALSQKFTGAALQELRANPDLTPSPTVKGALATLAPKEAAAMFPPAPDSPRPKAGARPAPPPELAAIQNNMRQIRGLPTDQDRAKLVLAIVADICALPAAVAKLGPISSLANLATEGDLGKDALNAVASTFALALKETPGTASNYVELAKLVRYEHLSPLPADPSLDAATAVLALHDEVVQESGFALTALDGKTYSLDRLRGKVVLLNFGLRGARRAVAKCPTWKSCTGGFHRRGWWCWRSPTKSVRRWRNSSRNRTTHSRCCSTRTAGCIPPSASKVSRTVFCSIARGNSWRNPSTCAPSASSWRCSKLRGWSSQGVVARTLSCSADTCVYRAEAPQEGRDGSRRVWVSAARDIPVRDRPLLVSTLRERMDLPRLFLRRP